MMKKKFLALVCAFSLVCMLIPGANALGLSGSNQFDQIGLGAAPSGSTEDTSTTKSASGTDSSSSLTDEELAWQEAQKNQISDLNGQISDLKQQQSALQQQINATKNQKQQAELKKQNIDSQLYNTSQQLQLTNQKIALLQQNIEETNTQIAGLQESIDLQYDQFKSQIRNTYMSPSYSFYEYLLGAQSFADFSVRMETVARLSALGQNTIDSLEQEIADLYSLQESLAADKEELDSSTSELEGLKSQLNSQSSEAQKYISDISQMEKAFLADTAALQAKQKQIQAEINQIYSELAPSGEYKGDGTWAWPVPGYSYISSPFGWRFQNTDYHTGMDIAGSGKSIYGARIVSCGDGTVVKVQNNGSNGYGFFCIIDHGGGYTTLYGHTSNIIVSVGDEVSKGQTIGYVGNSGWVIPSPSASNPTGGSHLHIEFRINGVAKNPANYLY